MLSCPDDIFVTVEAGLQSHIVLWYEPEYTDNSGMSPTIQQLVGLASGEKFVEGVHPIQYTATDTAGNINYQCAFKVQVRGERKKVVFNNRAHKHKENNMFLIEICQ